VNNLHHRRGSWCSGGAKADPSASVMAPSSVACSMVSGPHALKMACVSTEASARTWPGGSE